MTMQKMWDESAQTKNRMAAVHYFKDGVPMDESVYDDIFDEVNSAMEFVQTDIVLEVGAGSGLLLERIARRVNHISGTDISAKMLELVPKKQNVDVEQMDSQYLRFKTGVFDKVLCYSVVQYFPTMAYFENVFAEMVRVCKPGGKIFLGDLFNGYLESTFNEKGKAPWFRWGAWGEQKSEYFFIDPGYLKDLLTKLGCVEFEARVQLAKRKPLEHKMFRYDAVAQKKP